MDVKLMIMTDLNDNIPIHISYVNHPYSMTHVPIRRS